MALVKTRRHICSVQPYFFICTVCDDEDDAAQLSADLSHVNESLKADLPLLTVKLIMQSSARKSKNKWYISLLKRLC